MHDAVGQREVARDHAVDYRRGAHLGISAGEVSGVGSSRGVGVSRCEFLSWRQMTWSLSNDAVNPIRSEVTVLILDLSAVASAELAALRRGGGEGGGAESG